ncbi:MAG: hypothetical protein JOZ77_03170 [Candidatus Eremiobacteraeota bacterium]|nr:hypothetical protein [Candidatus Eremiobacteraeota bacterium]
MSELPRDFRLSDVLKQRHRFEREFPNNRFVDAKIRQSLQVLRDQGMLRFVSPGRYQRLDVAPVFSPLIDMALMTRFVSAAQATRVALETWASFNLFCLNCKRDELGQLPDNTPVADFQCVGCQSRYQLKGKNGRLGKRIPGAAYQPTIEAIRAGQCQNTCSSSSIRGLQRWFLSTRFRDASSAKIGSSRANRFQKKRGGQVGKDATFWWRASSRVRIVAPAGLDRANVRDEWRRL